MERPKVYICAHPQDLPLYAPMLKKQLQMHWLCEVLTDEELTQDPFIRYWLLRDVRLFVMPVTRRLLTEGGIAMRNYRFAREHLIAVMPWLMEDGIEELFTQKCGCMPFLRRDDSPELFLREFRMDRQTALRIRDTFDANVFVSTHPYDQRYARQLKCMIHGCWCCGNFGFPNRKEPEKGQIFVLALTHHTLEDASVQMEAYKKALELGLPVIAVEMMEVAHDRVRSVFPDVQEIVDCYDETELESAMLDALEAARIWITHDNTPEREYLLGLAFIHGVDVEVDRQYGVRLLESAAHCGWQEAKEKLRRMQHLGDCIRFERGQWHESGFSGF